MTPTVKASAPSRPRAEGPVTPGVLKYKKVKANTIFNWVTQRNITCWNQFPELHQRWWNAEVVDLRYRIERDIQDMQDILTNHFTKLRESIEQDGIKNPILCTTGLPRKENLKDTYPAKTLPADLDPQKTLSSFCFGGSRLAIAQDLDLTIPCLIYDFDNIITEHYSTIDSVEHAKTFLDDTYEVWVSTGNLRFTVHSFSHQPDDHNYQNNDRQYREMKGQIMNLIKNKYEREVRRVSS